MTIRLFKTSLIVGLLLSLLMTSAFTRAQFWSNSTAELLPEDQAFAVTAEIDNSGGLQVNWSIADDYYMYREQFSVESLTPGFKVGDITFPKGVIENDPEFGEVEVYFFNALLKASILPNTGSSLAAGASSAAGASLAAGAIELLIKGQGCNKPVGVCYPPLVRNLTVAFDAKTLNIAEEASLPQSNSNDSSDSNLEKSFLAYVASAFLAGILLSFTPCVLPMIPILAGVIAGQKTPSKMRSGWLAICYVAGTVVTYIVAGALAGATGAQLQAYFQNIWFISAVCAVLLVLAASLFGLFRIELPSSLQSKLNSTGSSTGSAATSSFLLGLVSALVVGACVSPILILALGAAITQGDPVLGAAIMGSMAIGMGLLLILFGFGAGWILPRAGAWMTQVQVLFGFMVLGVAIYLLSTLDFIPSLFLWSALLLCAGFYLWQIANDLGGQDSNKPLASSIAKMLSAGLLIWGAMALLGGANSESGGDILRPLESFSYLNAPATNTPTNNGELNSNPTASQPGRSGLPLVSTTTLAEVQTLLAAAKQAKQPVLIDFYADWCLDCKRMHRTTFKRASIHQALTNWSLIEIDVTDTGDDSEEVKRFFEVFGPPATLFVGSDGIELKQLRQYGYIKEQGLLDLIGRVK